jgi:hypothetical protein
MRVWVRLLVRRVLIVLLERLLYLLVVDAEVHDKVLRLVVMVGLVVVPAALRPMVVPPHLDKVTMVVPGRAPHPRPAVVVAQARLVRQGPLVQPAASVSRPVLQAHQSTVVVVAVATMLCRHLVVAAMVEQDRRLARTAQPIKVVAVVATMVPTAALATSLVVLAAPVWLFFATSRVRCMRRVVRLPPVARIPFIHLHPRARFKY